MLLVLLLLLFAALLAKLEVVAIGGLVVVDAPHGDLDGAGGDGIYELTVVADDDDGLGTVDEELFEPLDTLDVEVVRRLVEQEYVWVLEEQLGQLDAHAPSATEGGGGLVEVGTLETKAEQGFLHIFLEVGEVDGVELLAHGRHLLDKLHVRVALVVGALGQLLVHGFNLALHGMEVGKRLAGLFEDGAPVLGHQVLGQVGNDAILRCRDLSAGRLAYTGQNFQQSALAGTVLSHEGDAVLLIDLKRNVAKEGSASELYGEAVN